MDNTDDLLCALRLLFSLVLRLLEIFAVTLLYELLFYKLGFDFLSWVSAHTTFSLGGAAVVLFPALVEIYKLEEHEKKRADSRKNRPRRRRESAAMRAGGFLLSFLRTASRSGFCCLIGILLLWGVIPACAAHYHPGAKIGTFISHYVEDYGESGQQTSVPPVSAGPQVPAEPEPQDTEPEPLKSINFLEDPMCYKELTEADYDQVYFGSSEEGIEDWTDEDSVRSTVTEFVKKLLAEKKPNEFDVHASPAMQLEVSNADTDYDAMTSSTQLDSTINTHLEAWAHPKYGLAWLLTNEYQEYGNHYYAVEGHFQTIEYYYGQSIIWAEKALTFESATDDQVKTLLSYISYRYHDIADSAEGGSTVKQRATALYSAFKSIQNLDFSEPGPASTTGSGEHDNMS